jgi:hypothetical protein
MMAVVVAAMVYYFPSNAKLQENASHTFPIKAAAYLAQHSVPGPMFNNYGFGGYLIYSLAPEYKVFLDGRGDIYERGGVLADYLHIAYLKPGAFTVLQHYGIRSCLVERNEALATALGNSPDWKKIYSDDLSVLYVRNDSAGASQAN